MNSISPRLYWAMVQNREVKLDVSMLRFNKRGDLVFNNAKYQHCESCNNLLIENEDLVEHHPDNPPIVCHTCQIDDVMLTNQQQVAKATNTDLSDWY